MFQSRPSNFERISMTTNFKFLSLWYLLIVFIVFLIVSILSFYCIYCIFDCIYPPRNKTRSVVMISFNCIYLLFIYWLQKQDSECSERGLDPLYPTCWSRIFRPGHVIRDVVLGLLVLLGIAILVTVIFVLCFYVIPGENTLRIFFQILLNQTEIRLYLQRSKSLHPDHLAH